MDDRAAEVTGTITLPDGTKSEFLISSDGGWQQWGGDRDRLSRSVPIIEALSETLVNEGLLISDSDPE